MRASTAAAFSTAWSNASRATGRPLTAADWASTRASVTAARAREVLHAEPFPGGQVPVVGWSAARST